MGYLFAICLLVRVTYFDDDVNMSKQRMGGSAMLPRNVLVYCSITFDMSSFSIVLGLRCTLFAACVDLCYSCATLSTATLDPRCRKWSIHYSTVLNTLARKPPLDVSLLVPIHVFFDILRWKEIPICVVAIRTNIAIFIA